MEPTPDRTRLTAEMAREVARMTADAWWDVPHLAEKIRRNALKNGTPPDYRYKFAVAEQPIWTIAHTFNASSERPWGIGIDCDTGEFCLLNGQPATDSQVVEASDIPYAIDGEVVRGMLLRKLES